MNDARERTALTRVSSDRPMEPSDDARAEPWRRTDWQRLWLAARNQPWRSLALVPGGAGCAARLHGADRGLAGAHGHDASRCSHSRRRRHARAARPAHAIRPRNPVPLTSRAISRSRRWPRRSENPTAVSLAKTTDQAMLCVLLNRHEHGRRQEIGGSDRSAPVHRRGNLPRLRIDPMSALTVEKVESLQALMALEVEWRGLEGSSRSGLPFLTFDWCLAWWKHLREDKSRGSAICSSFARFGRRRAISSRSRRS